LFSSLLDGQPSLSLSWRGVRRRKHNLGRRGSRSTLWDRYFFTQSYKDKVKFSRLEQKKKWAIKETPIFFWKFFTILNIYKNPRAALKKRRFIQIFFVPRCKARLEIFVIRSTKEDEKGAH
jgi:hypothetical protein